MPFSEEEVMSDAESLGKAKVVGATDKALRVEVEDMGTIWVPRSVIHDDSEVYDEGHEGELVVKRWFAEKEGLI